MALFFINKPVPLEAVPQSMQDYLCLTGRTRSIGKKPVWAPLAEMLIYAPS